MKDKTLVKGLRKRPTYDKLVGYLDGEQDKIKWPDRLATQFQNSDQISNLVDSDGEGWFKQTQKQMRNFTQQQVNEYCLKQIYSHNKHINKNDQNKWYLRERKKASTRGQTDHVTIHKYSILPIQI